MIDFAGPWEVFQDVAIMDGSAGAMGAMKGPAGMTDMHPFQLYVVSDGKSPVRVSGGMTLVPDYTFDDAPAPNVIVIPAQSGRSPKMMDWLRTMARQSDVVMSVCAGAFTLAEAGLLDGKQATTHHNLTARFQHRFPSIHVLRDMRYEQSDSVIYTSGGLSSGIDLALHIVEHYFGRAVALTTARTMEYEGQDWVGDGRGSVRYSTRSSPRSPADGLSSGIFGTWEGSIMTSEGTSAVVVHIWPGAPDQVEGSVDVSEDDFSPFHSMDATVSGLAFSSVRFANNELRFDLLASGGVFEGRVVPTKAMIAGVWRQGATTYPLQLSRRP